MPYNKLCQKNPLWQPLKTFPYNQQWNRKVRVRGALPHTPISKNKFLPHTPISKNKFLEMPLCWFVNDVLHIFK